MTADHVVVFSNQCLSRFINDLFERKKRFIKQGTHPSQGIHTKRSSGKVLQIESYVFGYLPIVDSQLIANSLIILIIDTGGDQGDLMTGFLQTVSQCQKWAYITI